MIIECSGMNTEAILLSNCFYAANISSTLKIVSLNAPLLCGYRYGNSKMSVSNSNYSSCFRNMLSFQCTCNVRARTAN